MERVAQCLWPKVKFEQAAEWKPPELKPSFPLDATVSPSLVLEQRACGELYREVHANFVVRLSAVLKEVLAGSEKLTAYDGEVKFFFELADERLAALLPGFNPPAWKRPEGVSFEPMKQDVAVFDGYSACA